MSKLYLRDKFIDLRTIVLNSQILVIYKQIDFGSHLFAMKFNEEVVTIHGVQL